MSNKIDLESLERIINLRKKKRVKDGGIKFDTCIVGTRELAELIEEYKKLTNKVEGERNER